MKTKTKLLMTLGTLCIGTLVLGACAKADTTHSDLAKDGYTVVVTYERNGGVIDNNPGLNVVDRYSLEDVKNGGIKLIAPGDPIRGELAVATSTVRRQNYTLLGWYTSWDYRTDNGEENGRPLDENGELCSETGKDQGLVFDGYWDFATRVCTFDDLTESKENGRTVYTLTLYAAWMPNYVYDFYRPSTAEERAANPTVGEWVQYGSYSHLSDDPGKVDTIAVPDWDDDTGGMGYGNVPAYAGHTFEAVYESVNADGTFGKRFESIIEHSGSVNLENGTVEGMTMSLYTTWEDGEWFRISKAEQLSNKLLADGHYVIVADLDFAYTRNSNGTTTTAYYNWRGGSMTFTGTIQTDGPHRKISNIHFTQSNTNITCSGGVFGTIAEGAHISGVSFENVVYQVSYVAVKTSGSTYGLFAGAIDEKADIGEDVAISGTVQLGILTDQDETGTNYAKFTIGLVSGNGVLKGISYANCNVEILEVTVGQDVRGNPIKGWLVTAEVGEDGELIIALNPDKSVNPNEN